MLLCLLWRTQRIVKRGTLRHEWEGVVSWQLQMTSLCCSLSWEAALGSSRSKYLSFWGKPKSIQRLRLCCSSLKNKQ